MSGVRPRSPEHSALEVGCRRWVQPYVQECCAEFPLRLLSHDRIWSRLGLGATTNSQVDASSGLAQNRSRIGLPRRLAYGSVRGWLQTLGSTKRSRCDGCWVTSETAWDRALNGDGGFCEAAVLGYFRGCRRARSA